MELGISQAVYDCVMDLEREREREREWAKDMKGLCVRGKYRMSAKGMVYFSSFGLSPPTKATWEDVMYMSPLTTACSLVVSHVHEKQAMTSLWGSSSLRWGKWSHTLFFVSITQTTKRKNETDISVENIFMFLVFSSTRLREGNFQITQKNNNSSIKKRTGVYWCPVFDAIQHFFEWFGIFSKEDKVDNGKFYSVNSTKMFWQKVNPAFLGGVHVSTSTTLIS